MPPAAQTRVLVVRGHQSTPWELRAWERLPERFRVSYLLTESNFFDPPSVDIEPVAARTLRDYAPRGRIGDLLAGVSGDRYFAIDDALATADIVQSAELHYWFSNEVAKRKRRHGFKLVQTVWETLPLLAAFRNRHGRRHRETILAETDLFLAMTERARLALLLEGAPEDRVVVAPPGIDTERFADAVASGPAEHVVLSPGRLEWQKGHHDVLRAIALLARGEHRVPVPRVRFVGAGPERERLRRHAGELGIGNRVEFVQVPYEEMPRVFAEASCMVLASLPSAGCMRHPFDVPRCFWEEQFGMVLAEAMASGLPIVASDSGAIREVAGDSAEYFAPGDWPALAQTLAEGSLQRDPAERVEHPRERLQRYSLGAAGARLAAAYDALLD